MITTKPQKEEIFIFLATPELLITHAPAEYVEEMKAAVNHTACWLEFCAFKGTIMEFKKVEGAEESLVVILNLADAGANKLKELFFKKEELVNMEENGLMSIIVNKKQFLNTIPPYGFPLKKKIIAQEGVAVLVIDYGTIEVFSV